MPGLTTCRTCSNTAALFARATAATFAAAVAVGVVISPGADASVFKCITNAGGLIYQEAPCPPGKELRNFDNDPPTLSVIPGFTTPAPPRPQATRERPPGNPAASPAKHAKRTTAGHDDRNNGRVNGDALARKFIHLGMSDSEVRARIGQPDFTSRNKQSRNVSWSYLPAAADPETLTTITFTGNAVSDVARKAMKK